MPKISIVVPIYGVEKYLNYCIDSLLNQTLEDIEIILVDDGSPDNCGEIADQYAKFDKRIKVVHQANAGLGPARNSGMKVATGEYVGFVDSDDWTRPEMFGRLYEAAMKNNADIIVSGHCDVNEGVITKKKIHPLAGKTLQTKQDILEIRKNLFGHSPNDNVVEAFPMSVCMSIYKRRMIEDNDLRFKEILSEDTIFNLSAYKCANKITFTGDTDYCYRKEDQPSITQSFSDKKLLRYIEFLTMLTQIANEETDKECMLRVKRMAIDYCRLYIGLVDNSGESLVKKIAHVKKFAQTEIIKECWSGYPIKTLPIQQWIFQELIEKKWYGVALILNRMRQKAKKEGRWN
jgi:glycosyltransferase EpsJ